MKLTVIGASAGVGRQVVECAVHRGHEVTALARSEMAGADWVGVRTVQGNALDPEVLQSALEGAEAVVVALGTRKNTEKTTLFSDFARALLSMRRVLDARVPVLFITGFGAGESAQAAPLIVRLLLRFLLKEVYADKTRMEELVAASDLAWTLVRPGQLLDAPAAGNYRVETEFHRGMRTRAISRADVASFCVAQCESQEYLRARVGLFGQ